MCFASPHSSKHWPSQELSSVPYLNSQYSIQRTLVMPFSSYLEMEMICHLTTMNSLSPYRTGTQESAIIEPIPPPPPPAAYKLPAA